MNNKILLGAIAGDVIGSVYEFRPVKSVDFPLFSGASAFTDDTVMTMAHFDWLLNGGDLCRIMQEYGRRYPNRGYGSGFRKWIWADNPRPYGSYGNGSAMRVSGCGWVGADPAEVESLATAVTKISHNHPEGIKGAVAVAMAIFLARTGKTQDEIRAYIEAHYYPQIPSLEEIRPNYSFNETCQGTMPQAIAAFLEATSFEDTIRNAVSIGGDSDTIAAIAGSIAEPYFGIPESMRSAALAYLDKEQRSIVERFEALYGAKVLAS